MLWYDEKYCSLHAWKEILVIELFQCLVIDFASHETFLSPCSASPHARNRDLALEKFISQTCNEIYYFIFSITVR